MQRWSDTTPSFDSACRLSRIRWSLGEANLRRTFSVQRPTASRTALACTSYVSRACIRPAGPSSAWNDTIMPAGRPPKASDRDGTPSLQCCRRCGALAPLLFRRDECEVDQCPRRLVRVRSVAEAEAMTPSVRRTAAEPPHTQSASRVQPVSFRGISALSVPTSPPRRRRRRSASADTLLERERLLSLVSSLLPALQSVGEALGLSLILTRLVGTSTSSSHNRATSGEPLSFGKSGCDNKRSYFVLSAIRNCDSRRTVPPRRADKGELRTDGMGSRNLGLHCCKWWHRRNYCVSCHYSWWCHRVCLVGSPTGRQMVSSKYMGTSSGAPDKRPAANTQIDPGEQA